MAAAERARFEDTALQEAFDLIKHVFNIHDCTKIKFN